jgi:hypothetical protein
VRDRRPSYNMLAVFPESFIVSRGPSQVVAGAVANFCLVARSEGDHRPSFARRGGGRSVEVVLERAGHAVRWTGRWRIGGPTRNVDLRVPTGTQMRILGIAMLKALGPVATIQRMDDRRQAVHRVRF